MKKTLEVVAIANSKGGVGKTTLAVHLAVGLARAGHQVLLVDLDPQKSGATGWLLGDMPPGTRGTFDVIKRGKAPILAEELHEAPQHKGLWVLPSSPELLQLDVALAAQIGGQENLKRALAKEKRFDYAILDCPPNLGTGVVCALCAADSVFVPILPGYMSIKGLVQLEDAIEQVRERLNPRTYIRGYVLFAVDPREAVSGASRELLQREAPDQLFPAEVRISTAGKSLMERRTTAWEPGADPRGAEDYPAVLKEALKRLEKRP